MIFVIILWIIIIYLTIKEKDGWEIIAGLFYTMVLMIVLFIPLVIIETSSNLEKEYKPIKKEILSLDDTDNTSGSFFLGSGDFGNKQVFTFYYKTSDGGYKRDYESASKTTIYEDENTSPYIQYNMYRKISWDSKWRFWLLFYTIDNKNSKFDYLENIEIHVPENTIIKEISLDNKN